MTNKPISIMKLRTLISYKQEGRSHQFIGKVLKLSRTTVVKYLQNLASSSLNWVALLALSDESLLLLCRSGHCDKPDDQWSGFNKLLPGYAQALQGLVAYTLWHVFSFLFFVHSTMFYLPQRLDWLEMSALSEFKRLFDQGE